MQSTKGFSHKIQAFLEKHFWTIVVVMLVIIVIGVLQTAQAAFPVDAMFRWTDPTEYTDGTPLDPDLELVRYEAFCTKGGAEVFRQTWPKEVGVAEKFFSGAFDGAGTYECQMKVLATNDLWSAWSNVATKHVTGNPNAPVIVEFQAGRQPAP